MQSYSSAATKVIDPVENLKHSQVYLLSGKYDSVILPGVVKKLEEYYSHFVSEGNISSVFHYQLNTASPLMTMQLFLPWPTLHLQL